MSESNKAHEHKPAQEQTKPEVQTPETDPVVLAAAAEAKRKVIAEKRLALKKDIADAKAKINMPEAALEAFKKAVPALYADMLSQIELAEQALKDYNLSVLSPEEAAAIKTLEELIAARDKAIAAHDAHLAECKTKYPDNEKWGKVTTTNTRAPRQSNSDGKIIPYSGREIPTAELEGLVKEQIAKGVTSENEIIRAIFGEGFTISRDKEASNANKYNPSGRVHSIRVKLGVVAEK